MALSVAWVLMHAFLVDAVTVRLCDEVDKGIPPDRRLPVFLNEIANDGYVWNRYAEELGQNGRWRLRYTTFDNAPDGRSVHWNSAFAWYLRGLGELRRSVTGEPLRHAIFRMSIWANPLLLAIALVSFAPLVATRFGPLSGAVVAIGMVSVPTFYEGFMPAYPDHHGLISFMLLGMAFGIAWGGAGWVALSGHRDFAAATSLTQARHGMTFSAICGACGLWFSALSTSMVLGTVGISAILTAACFRRSRPDDPVFHAELWKWWGMCGAGGAMVLWLLEYFPNHMSMRLEVNHPFYALAWLGGAWMIAAVGGWLAGEVSVPKTQDFPWQTCAWSLLACAVLPAAIWIGGAAVYIPQDPFMSRLWRNIFELLPITVRIQHTGLSWHAAFGWYPFLLVASFVLLVLKRPGRGAKASLLFLAVPIVILTGLQFYQSRWGLLVGPIYIALAAMVFPQIWHLVPRTDVARGIAGVSLAAVGIMFVLPSFGNAFTAPWRQYRSANIPVLPGQALQLLHRQMARAILDDANGQPVVLLSSPNSSCVLAALGGFRTMGTLYWENVDGLKAAAKALNAQSDAEALRLLEHHGVTHVSLLPWENFIEPYFHILYPQPETGISVKQSFAQRALFEQIIPVWTRPLVFPANALSKVLNQRVLLLRVAPGQSESETSFYLARFIRHVEGKPEIAVELLKKSLEASPDSSAVRVEYADALASVGKFDEAVNELTRAMKDADGPTRDMYVGNFANSLIAARQYKPLASLLRTMAARKDATPTMVVQAAWLLATLPDDKARDGAFAKRILDELDPSTPTGADQFLARAAAHAACGDFAAALAALDDQTFTQVATPDQKRIAATLRTSYQQGKVFLNQ